jgi:hypothetical protein
VPILLQGQLDQLPPEQSPLEVDSDATVDLGATQDLGHPIPLDDVSFELNHKRLKIKMDCI